MRKPILAGNWKMSKTLYESVRFVRDIRPLLTQCQNVDIVVFPSFVALHLMSETLKDSNIAVGAQNIHWAESGAYTGEVSASMVEEIAGFVLIGHSERREYFSETDAIVNKKIKAALAHGLTPIVCVGENLEQKEAGATDLWVCWQVQLAFNGLSAEEAAVVLVAYEPIWAIGTGKSATADDANRVCGSVVRGMLAKMYGEQAAQRMRILYGGSANEKNIGELMAMPDIDGALIGGASLKADPFVEMINITSQLYK